MKSLEEYIKDVKTLERLSPSGYRFGETHATSEPVSTLWVVEKLHQKIGFNNGLLDLQDESRVRLQFGSIYLNEE